MKSTRFEVVTTTAGAVSILNRELNEIMHNPVGPWKEANALYITQSKFIPRWLETDQSLGDFVVFDVGLGAAANAIAALTAIKNNPNPNRQFKLISFERDLELLEFALQNAGQFPHFEGFTDPIRALLKDHSWSHGNVTWILKVGDFRETLLQQPFRPHLIFFDPYSPKVNQEMWTSTVFKNLRTFSRTLAEGGTTLYTYSQSTPIRVALLEAGFFVGLGLPTGLKEQTTQAASDLSLLDHPLDAHWLGRWRRSHTPFPYLTPLDEQPALRERIEGHLQFVGADRGDSIQIPAGT